MWSARRFTLVAVDSQAPDTVAGARRTPLVVGVGEGENFVASDVAAFIEHTREAIELGQDQLVSITPDGVEVITFDGEPAVVKPYHVDWDLSAAEKGGYDWFMRKEIYEQPRAVADTLLGRHDANASSLGRDPDFRGGATSRRQDHRGGLRHRLLRRTRGQVRDRALDPIPCEVELASEFRYRDPIVGPTTRRRDQPVRRRPPTPDGHQARTRAAVRVLAIATRTAQPSRASPMQ